MNMYIFLEFMKLVYRFLDSPLQRQQDKKSRSRRRNVESQSVSCSYVSNGETSQRKGYVNYFFRLFEDVSNLP